MTIEEFWNQAFISCLIRLPAEEAKTEADKATEICILHWNSLHAKYQQPPTKWQKQDIGKVFIPEHTNKLYPGSNPFTE